MDFNATIDLIIKDLDETRNIIDDLKKYPGVPVLQIELAKSRCKSAAEVIALLKSLKSSIPDEVNFQPEPEKVIDSHPSAEEEKTRQSKEDNREIIVTGVSSNIEEKEMKPDVTDSELFSASHEVSKKTPRRVPESPIIADKFSHLSDRFNEKLVSKSGDEDSSDIMKTQHLTNLSDAIGVNDRFLFIREIFNGDRNAYNKAISELDSAETISDARSVIQSYSDDSEGNKAVKQLLDLVKRKLPANE